MKRRDPRKPTEYQIQAAVVERLRLTALPGVLFLHVPNQQAGGPKRGAYLKRMGVLPGAADLCLMGGDPMLGDALRVLWLELKAPGKAPTKLQLAFRSRAEAIGCEWAWADSVEGAILLLRDYGWCR